MNRVSSSKNSTVLVIILIAVVLFAVYYYVVKPKKDEVVTMENTVVNLQSEITELEANIVSTKVKLEDKTSNDFALRKKVPQSRNMMELLQSIEEVEFISESRILSISFNNYDTLVAESELQDPNEPDSSEDEGSASEQQTETKNMPISTIAKESLPAELKMVTFSMEIESPNKSKLEQFIKEIEALERVMHVDNIEFSLPGEENEIAEDSSEVVSATIQVTTFYYDGK